MKTLYLFVVAIVLAINVPIWSGHNTPNIERLKQIQQTKTQALQKKSTSKKQEQQETKPAWRTSLLSKATSLKKICLATLEALTPTPQQQKVIIRYCIFNALMQGMQATAQTLMDCDQLPEDWEHIAKCATQLFGTCFDLCKSGVYYGLFCPNQALGSLPDYLEINKNESLPHVDATFITYTNPHHKILFPVDQVHLAHCLNWVPYPKK